MQSRNAEKILKIPSLGKNSIYSITPGAQNSPLFQYKKSGIWLSMTDSQIRAHFKLILNKLHLQDSSLTFHAF